MFTALYNRFRRITSNHMYFPEIDGIRFLAIVLVVLFHAHGYFVEKSGIAAPVDSMFYAGFAKVIGQGNRGVQLFFVLSGFILCLPFAHYYINNGKKVSLKRYYLRRVTRLEPPYFIAMIGLFCAMVAMHAYPVSFLVKSLLASLTYTHNIILQHTPYLTVVAWSLEIEIQFYLLAPILFRVLALSKGARRSVLCTAIVVLAGLHQVFPLHINTIYNHLHYFLAGILLADFYVSGDFTQAADSLMVKLLALLLFLAVLLLPFKEEFGISLIYPFIVFAFYLTILRNNGVKKVFSFGYLPIIGGMCYSIYLLHYPLISMVGRFTMRFKAGDAFLPNMLLQLAAISVIVLAVSSLFYIFIERPFMHSKWTDKLMKKDKHEETINPVSVPDVVEAPGK
jgi:peptidoglycan/LPS O-acetylase OafA/YrhL